MVEPTLMCAIKTHYWKGIDRILRSDQFWLWKQYSVHVVLAEFSSNTGVEHSIALRIAQTQEQATTNAEVMGLTPRECMNW